MAEANLARAGEMLGYVTLAPLRRAVPVESALLAGRDVQVLPALFVGQTQLIVAVRDAEPTQCPVLEHAALLGFLLATSALPQPRGNPVARTSPPT